MHPSKISLFSILVATAVVATPGLAQSAPEGTQAHMNEVSCDHLHAAQKRMQSGLAAIRKRYASDTAFLAKFEAAQRAWQRYADAELDAYYPVANTNPANTGASSPRASVTRKPG
jgi:Lysozyme inhibitor LprI